MKKIFIPIILIFAITDSCSKKQNENTYSISEKPEYIVKSDVIFAAEGKDSLNNFSELVIVDSFLVTDDEFSKIIKIYKNLNFSESIFFASEGNGPRDIISPVEINKAVNQDNIILFESPTFRLKKIQVDANNNFSDFESEFLQVKNLLPIEINVTKNNIIGENIDNHKIFIYNKKTKNIVNIDYFLEPDKQYDEHGLISLHDSRLVANEEKESICAAMFYVNYIVFFNLKGEFKKTVTIGNKLNFPVFNSSNNPKLYFTNTCGTAEYIYCLYKGTTANKALTDSKIFVFNWLGEHITTIKTNGNIWNSITVDKNNKYILGLSYRNGYNTTDIVKIPLDGILKK